MKTNAIRQYRPAFFEGFENETVEFSSLKEMLEIPWVKHFSTDPTFHQFSISNDNLMAEYREGREWWVVGFLKDPNVELPAWNNGLYEVWDNGEPKDIPGHLVASTCGDKVVLRDGRVVERREAGMSNS